MSRFIAISFLAKAVGLAVGMIWSDPVVAQAQDRPNFVVILADDLGYGDVGPYGAELIKTPNLERMAGEGITLTSFYSSANICTPSRGGLLCGRYPVRMDLVRDVARPGNDVALDPDEITIAESLKDAGYATACIGKWHLGHLEPNWPTNQGFDYYYGLPYSNDMRPLALYRMSESIEDSVDQSTLTERYTHEAVRFIEEHKDGPFFVYLPHTMPHIPLFVSEKFHGKSEAGLYGDVVETIDWSIGQIFDTLKRLDLDENTLVIFTSDNGPWYEGSAGVYRGRKGTAWDGGMRVPCLARWPGKIPAGAKTGAMAMNIDIFPTLAKLAGAHIPDDRPIDGKDIFPLLEGGAESPHDYLFLFDRDQIAAVRTQRWKLVVQTFYRNVSVPLGSEAYYFYPGLLFDLEKDPEERFSFTREQPELAEELRAQLDAGEQELRPTR